ncbi:hypothetical protein EVG20_g2617 [Dentipellis fragilis]|uniref:F-box domain-containing protein n=1 Tax=Dentipellis fragilis TaxID=205917 RepID=A0A4Y9Z970_9AGAM|nr:hypothetical protein EVG20_g2617 [Dentipellis fragilis]
MPVVVIRDLPTCKPVTIFGPCFPAHWQYTVIYSTVRPLEQKKADILSLNISVTTLPSSLGFAQARPSDSVAPEVQQLNDEYRNLVARMVANRSRVNTMAPVFNLPDELLLYVFSLLAPSREYDSTRDAWQYLIRITYVCSRWRKIAVGSPSLWTVVGCSFGSKLTESMLSRSKTLPVNVVFDHADIMRSSYVSRIDCRRLFELIAKHKGHIKQLTLKADVHSPGSRLENALLQFHGPLPLLEKFEVDGSLGERNAIAYIPRKTFRDMPALRELVLRNVLPSVSLPAPPAFSNLVTFRINMPSASDDIFYHPTFPSGDLLRHRVLPTMNQLLDMLGTMHSLEYLSMDCAFPEVHLDAPHPETHVARLPRLSFLHLSGSMLECASLAEHLDFPHTARMELDGYEPVDFEDGRELPFVNRVLEHHYARQTSASQAFGSVSISHWDGFFEFYVSVATQVIIYIRMRPVEGQPSVEFWRRVFATIPMGKSASFSWHSDEPVTLNPDDFEAIFSQPSLATISSVQIGESCPSLHPISPALTYKEPPEGLSKNRRVFNVLPGLRNLTISNMDCTGLDGGDIRKLHDEIANIIRERESLGIPLRSVEFTDLSSPSLGFLWSLKHAFPDIIHGQVRSIGGYVLTALLVRLQG